METQITDTALEIITGSMLGDGSLAGNRLYPNRNWYFRKGQSKLDHKGIDKISYVQWHVDQLSKYVNTVLDISNTMYSVRTSADPFFTELAKVWYRYDGKEFIRKNNKIIKRLPSNISLTPLSVTIWFMDDGCNVPENRCVDICTQSFEPIEVETLVDKLREIDILSHIYLDSNKQPMIRVKTCSYLDFIEMVKSNIHWSCFLHKTALDKYTSPNKAKGERIGISKLKEKDVLVILDLREQKYTIKAISDRFAVSTATISNIVNGKTWKHVVL